jgi:hypothetical protein
MREMTPKKGGAQTSWIRGSRVIEYTHCSISTVIENGGQSGCKRSRKRGTTFSVV